jgi:hypothetical protein
MAHPTTFHAIGPTQGDVIIVRMLQMQDHFEAFSNESRVLFDTLKNKATTVELARQVQEKLASSAVGGAFFNLPRAGDTRILRMGSDKVTSMMIPESAAQFESIQQLTAASGRNYLGQKLYPTSSAILKQS